MLRKDFELAKNALDKSQVIASPTETVMGLGVYYNDFEAYNLLNKIKCRPEDKPYTLMLGSIALIEEYAYITNRDKRIIEAFMPGEMTILLTSKESVPGYVTHNTGVIGIRVPKLKVIQDLINYLNKPLLVPSANKSGEKPAITSVEVRNIFHNEVSYIFEGKAEGGVPSTIVDLTKEEVKIVREGPISLKDILAVL